ncbi:MAG: hypothetical protein PGN30_13425 [Mycolicibacterium neoaurum]|uniref:ATP-binding protein n=1 Tax=Mycolicibacterium neoaurum TaxID=1795 RepID=UPI002FFCA4B4
MATTTFETSHSGQAFWDGFARQTIDCQHAIGELIDNALSAPLPNAAGTGAQPAVIELTLRELDNGVIRLQVADAGTGIPWAALTGTPNVFDIGYRPATPGRMNEHGFGLKNALALLTSGFSRDFKVLSRPTDSGGAIYAVSGPIAAVMQAQDDCTTNDWEEDLDVLAHVSSGTKVVADISAQYFKTVYGRAAGFEVLVNRLAEHLGVMYSVFLEEGNQIWVRYRSAQATNWLKHQLVPVPTPFLSNAQVQVTEKTLTFEVDGLEYSAVYRYGLLDKTVKDSESGRPWPYPLRIHFQGSNARCGISLIVRGRVLKTGVFREIWPDKAGDVSFNNFLGELILDERFRTTNNKTDLDLHAAVTDRLFDQLREDFQPEKATKRASEESLRKAIIKQLSTVHGLTGADLPKHKTVWDGSADIDIYYRVGASEHLIETKVEAGQVADVYQLLMYWDGLVDEGKHPTEGVLVAASIPASVAKAIAHINDLKDKNGTNYALKTQTIDEWAE